jgi:uncharacterized protein YndB with AHSA1/START domain
MTTMTRTGTSTYVYRIYIKASPEAIWEAITNPEWARRYGYRGGMEYELRAGGEFRALASQEMKEHGAPDVIIDGAVLEVDPPRRLVQTWRVLVDPQLTAEGFTRLTWEIDKDDAGFCRLTVTHELDGAPGTAAMVTGESPTAGGGWSFVLSDLKTLLETGQTLDA